MERQEENLKEYVKAPLEMPWDYDESKYDMDQLKYASAVVTGPSGTDGEYIKKDFHLPHHLPGDGKTHGGTLVWRGVAAAGAIIQGGRGGVNIGSEDKAKAKTHLATHYREFDKTPPWEQEGVSEAVGGMDVCGQCRSFQDLSDKTIQIQHVTGGDSVGITRTEGAIGPGVGRCSITEKLVRKQDAACTDGRPRDSPTGLDRTMEHVKELAQKAELLREIAFEKTLLQESINREATEREAKIRSMQENVSKDQHLIKLQKELAELTSIHVKTKEELENLRKANDDLKEQNVRIKIGMDNTDRDIKLYKDQNDRYERSVQKVSNEVVQVKEELTKALIRANDETAKRAEAVQRGINADNDRSRIQSENALLMQQLSEKTYEISDYAKRLSDSATRELKMQRELQGSREERTKIVDEIRDLKQKLTRIPKEFHISI